MNIATMVIGGWVLIGLISFIVSFFLYFDKDDYTLSDLMGSIGFILCGPIATCILIADILSDINWDRIIWRRKHLTNKK